MRYVTILILVLSNQLLNAQSFYVEGKGYKGYGFDKDHFVFMSIENQKERYDLRQIDISVVEQYYGFVVQNYNFFLKLSPFRSKRCDECTILSNTASAMTSFSITSYHLLTGNWLAIIVAFRSCLSSIISIKHSMFLRKKNSKKLQVFLA